MPDIVEVTGTVLVVLTVVLIIFAWLTFRRPKSAENPKIETHFRSIRQTTLLRSDFREWRPLGAARQMAMGELNAKHSAPIHKVRRRSWVRHRVGHRVLSGTQVLQLASS